MWLYVLIRVLFLLCRRILAVNSADEFYSIMGVVTREMLELGLMDPNALVKCIVSVGPFPFPALAELRQQQRAIIQQDTPYKSFFLAKRELDNLKRHYAAMKDRQKATTIILRGLETSRIRVPGQRSNSLFVAPTMKKQMVNLGVSQNKQKMRRASSGGKGALCNNNINNLNSNNLNNMNAARSQQNGMAGQKVVSGKQITMTWDKAAPKIRSKQFRRRRTASASSGHTDSSSDTELCDSNSSLSSDSSDSEGVWSETDGRWKKPKANKKSKSDSPCSASLKSNKSNLSLCPVPQLEEEPKSSTAESIPEIVNGAHCHDNNKSSLPPLETPEGSQSHSASGEDHVSSEEGSPPSSGNALNATKILDTNDSQHFLEEISRLGKSDSFYENLSKRICELQFQNLRILNSCQTAIDPKSLMLPEFERSPLPSPMATDNAGDLFLQDSSFKLTPNPTPKNFLSPRGSLSSLSDCHLGASSLINSPLRSPLSPAPSLEAPLPKSRRSSYTKRSSSGNRSSQSISSMDIPDICVDGPITSTNGNVDDCVESSEKIADSVAEFILSLTTEQKESTTEITEKVNSPKRNSAGLTLDLSGCNAEGSVGIKAFTPLKTPDFLQLNNLSHQNSKDNVDFGGNEVIVPGKVDIKSCLVSPVLSPDLTETSLKSKNGKGSPSKSPPKDISFPPRPKNFPVSPVEEFLLAYSPQSTATTKNGCHAHDDDQEDEFLCRSGGACHGDDVCFPTTACPCQCQTTEEINAVIRQNIAILQRLKLKPAYDLALAEGSIDGGVGEDDEYEDLEEYEDGEGSSCSDYSGGFPELTNLKENDPKGDDSSDRDSGVPTCSSKNSLSRKASSECSGGKKGCSSTLRHQDSSGCSSGGSSSAISAAASASCQQQQAGFSMVSTTTTQTPSRRRNSSGGSVNRSQVRRKSLTRTTSGQEGENKQKKNFNPFPTTRKARVRTSKFGLYN